jgi:anti-sigma28 factor (negative regulator of flagellin synthesis)
MARIAAVLELQPTDRRKSQEARNDQARPTSPDGDGLMEQILEDLNTTPPEEVLQRIASLPHIRRGKVLTIRRQITEGTYEVAGRLDRAIDRVREDCVFVLDAGGWRRTSHRMTMTCCTM